MTKKITLIIAIVAMVVVIGVVALVMTFKTEQRFEEVTFELGDQDISSDPADYIKGSKFMLNMSSVDLSHVDMNTVGTYRAVCRAGIVNYFYTVRVVDTAAPVITFKDSSSDVYATCSEISASDIASVNDFSPVASFEITNCVGNSDQIQLVDGKVIIEESGSYVLTVTSTDKYGNESEETTTVEVVEAPHFLMLSDRLYDVDNPYDVMDFVFAEDRFGNDISEDIVVVDDGGYDSSSRGSYEVTYEITDADGLTHTETITIRVGLSNNHSLGFEDTNFIPFFREHGYFSYEPLVGNEDLDAVAEVISRSSFAVKNNYGWCSCCLLEMTDNYMYFLTNKHCSSFFDDFDTFYLVDFDDNRFPVNNRDVEVFTHPTEDILIFKVPVSYVEPYYLMNYCSVIYDADIWYEVGPGTPIFLDAQQWGYVDRNDIIESTTIANMDFYVDVTDEHTMSTTSLIGTPGTSGCPIFTYEGYLIGLDLGTYSDGTNLTAVLVRLVDITYLVNSVEFV